MMWRHPVDSGNYGGIESAAVAVQNSHRNHLNFFGDSVSSATDRAGNVSSVSVAISCGAAWRRFVDPSVGTADEIDVTEIYSRVDYVRPHTGAVGAVGVRAVQRKRDLVDAIASPRRASLNRNDTRELIRLDQRNSR